VVIRPDAILASGETAVDLGLLPVTRSGRDRSAADWSGGVGVAAAAQDAQDDSSSISLSVEAGRLGTPYRSRNRPITFVPTRDVATSEHDYYPGTGEADGVWTGRALR
jgi:hypothetical protein